MRYFTDLAVRCGQGPWRHSPSMATIPPIPDSDRRVDYTPSSLTTDFVVPWPVIADSNADAEDDLYVWVAGVGQLDTSAFSFTGNVIVGVPGIFNGGTVSLNTGVTGVRVVIISQRAPQRTGNFLEGKALPFSTLDTLLDDQAVQLRDLYMRSERSLAFPAYDPPQDLTGPDVATRSGQLASYDGAGKPSVPNISASQLQAAVAAYIGGVTAGSIVAIVDSIAALQANVVPFPIIATKSYLTGLNRGGYQYFLDTNDTTSNDNGVTIIKDAANHRYKVPIGALINQYHAGAKGHGTRATDAVLSTGGGARTITSAAKGFLGTVAGMTYIAQDAGGANTGGRPDPIIGTVITAAADGSQITIDADIQRNLTAVTVCCGYPDDAALDALMTAWGSYKAAVSLVHDKHLLIAKKQWGGAYSNKASVIKTIGRPLLMFAVPNYTDDLMTISGFDQGNVQFSAGQRMFPVSIEDLEIECNNRGKAGLVTVNMTGSYIRARVLNSHECVFTEMPTIWQERNTYNITGGRGGHHGHRRTDQGAVFNNSNIYQHLEFRGVGENSKLLGADITAAAATNQAGCAEYNYSGGNSSVSDSGQDGHTYIAAEFDAERTTALANGSDTNPNSVVCMDASATTLLEGAPAAHYSNFYTGFDWGPGNTIEDITEGSDGRGGARFYGQPNTNCDRWTIPTYGAGPWGSQSYLFSGTSNGLFVTDQYNFLHPKMHYSGIIDSSNDFTAPNFTTRTTGRSGAIRDTIGTSATKNIDIPLPPIFTGANRGTDFLFCTIKIWHLHTLDNGTPGAGVTEAAVYAGALLGDFDGTNFVTSNVKALLASPGTYFSVAAPVIDYINNRVRCAVTTTAAWGAGGTQPNVYATVTFDGGINTLF